jgi:hypothetical protein
VREYSFAIECICCNKLACSETKKDFISFARMSSNRLSDEDSVACMGIGILVRSIAAASFQHF